MSEQKPDESFKVVDRRLFTETGEFRRDVAEQSDRDHESSAAAERTKVITSAAANAAAAARPDSPGEIPAPAAIESTGPADAAPVPDASGRVPNRAFQMLVDFIARNAAMLLGGYQDPRTGQPLLDLEGAREIIDMLDALRETTRGNLAAEDDRILLDVIGSLKLSFMEISKAAAAAMKEKANKVQR